MLPGAIFGTHGEHLRRILGLISVIFVVFVFSIGTTVASTVASLAVCTEARILASELIPRINGIMKCCWTCVISETHGKDPRRILSLIFANFVVFVSSIWYYRGQYCGWYSWLMLMIVLWL